jgi:ATP-binding cassette subfamily C protein CydC
VWFYEKLIPLSPARLLSQRSGDLLNRMVNDIDTLDHLYLNILSPFLISFVMIIASTLFIAYFAKPIALINVSIILTAIVFISLISLKKAISIGKKIQHAQATLRIQMIDSLQGFVDLLLFQDKKTRLSALNKQNALIDNQKKLSHAKAFIISAMSFASGINIFCALWIGIPLVNQNQLSGAILAMIILLIIALYEQLMILPLACLALGKTKESANRLLSIANQAPAVVFLSSDCGARTSIAANQCDHALAFQNVSFSYPDRPKLIFDDFSLTVPANKHIGISAPSGFGKTTLLNLIARIVDPKTGHILLGNADLKSFSEVDLRKLISYVTQQIHIFNASVRDNVTLFQPEIADDLIWHELEKMDLADTILKSSDGLNTMMGEFGKNFSGGQIRRVAIARALLANTPILLMDEPSTGLEDKLTDRIWKNCEKDFKNKTVIIATHDPILLEKMASSHTEASEARV